MKIAVSPLDSGVAHITRCYEVALNLSRSGVDTFFHIPKEKMYVIKNGKKDNNLSFEHTARYLEGSSLKDIPAFFLRTSRKYHEEKELIEKNKIEALVVDFNPSGAFAAFERGVPLFIVINSYNLLFSTQVPFFKGKLKLIFFPIYLPVVVISSLIKFFYNIFPAIILKPWKTFSFFHYLYSCTKIIPEEFKAFEHRFNPNIHFVNGINTSAYKDIAFDVDRIKKKSKGRPLVYLSTGGTGFDRDIYEKLLGRLIDKGYFVIGSTGGRFKVQYNHSDAYIRDFLPGDRVCQMVDIVVNHGGQGSVVQALNEGKAVIAFPQNMGQVLVADWLAEEKNGIRMFTIFEFDKALEKIKKIKVKKPEGIEDGARLASKIILNKLEQ